MLTQPEFADAAKKALAGKLGFPAEQATVRTARWTSSRACAVYGRESLGFGNGPTPGRRACGVERARAWARPIRARTNAVWDRATRNGGWLRGRGAEHRWGTCSMACGGVECS